MDPQNFFSFFKQYANPYRIGLVDLADSVNLITVVYLMILAAMIATKQYLFNSMSCFIPVAPNGGSDFKDYLTDYCWVHGTIPFRPNERLPENDREWDSYDRTRRINYYQWVPFVLGLQCIFFYIPHIAWQAICSQRAGGDLFSLVQAASAAATESREARQGNVNQVAEFLQDMIDGHKTCRH
ncbi:Innexin inx2, partial [Cichlidogyrus casuarinus]